MKVFRIRLNSNVFQSFLPADSNVWKTKLLEMECTRKLPTWVPPDIFVYNPKLTKGCFYHLCSGAFVVDMSMGEPLRSILEMAGELLPLPQQGPSFYLMNVLECVNCLDQKKTKWVLGKSTGAKLRIEEYHFDPNRFSESTLFKIPETAMGEILTLSGVKDPEDEFKSLVEHEGLKGIIFEEVWSS